MPFTSDLVPVVWDRLAKMVLSDVPIGLTTGLPALDKKLGQGWDRQSITYLAGDSGKGKSWLASFWALHAAKFLHENPDQAPMSGLVLRGKESKVTEKENKKPIVVFWSLEMTELPITVRLMTQTIKMVTGTDLDSGLLRQGKLGVKGREYPKDSPEWFTLSQALGAGYATLLNGFGENLYIDFESRSVPEFREVLNELARDSDTVLVIVDYFRLITELESDGTIPSAQAEKSQQLKALAQEYDCHVVSLFDINREGQKAKRTGLEHMRGGVAAQYDADNIMILSWEVEELGIANPIEVEAELRLAKHRMGGSGTLKLFIDLSTGYIEARE